MTRLKKAHVEALLGDYDTDAIGALTAALRIVLDKPAGDWNALLDAAKFSDGRRERLQLGEQTALDALAAELNEARQLLR